MSLSSPAPARFRRLASQFAGALLALATVAAVSAVAAPASATSFVSGVRLNAYEARLVSLVNQARSAHGLRRVIVTAGATDVARRWAAEQASSDRMSHNPSFAQDLASAGGTNWHWAAENVGFGNAADPDQLFQLYMNSPLHRANILAPQARYVGMGVVPRLVDSWLMVYNTMNFNDYYSTSYGPTRTPASALPLDGDALPSSTYVASFERGVDQRVATAGHGDVASSAARTDVPTPADNAVRWTVREGAASDNGYADLELHQALDLSSASIMQLRLRVDTVGVTSVPVTVLVARYRSSTVEIGHADVTRTKSTFSFTLPAAARDYRDTIIVRVPASAVRHLPIVNRDRSVRLSLFAVRVV
ncbi:MAG: hypothetical protein JWM93_85 [Frankiales bacterium]|nr:hypothetical protein [Frankiales bacterium]